MSLFDQVDHQPRQKGTVDFTWKSQLLLNCKHRSDSCQSGLWLQEFPGKAMRVNVRLWLNLINVSSKDQPAGAQQEASIGCLFLFATCLSGRSKPSRQLNSGLPLSLAVSRAMFSVSRQLDSPVRHTGSPCQGAFSVTCEMHLFARNSAGNNRCHWVFGWDGPGFSAR